MRHLLLLIYLFSCGSHTFAQTVPAPETIIADYIRAVGGAEAWRAKRAIVTTGVMYMQGRTLPMRLTSAAGDRVRMEIEMNGSKVIQAFDGQTAWQVMPFANITEPTVMRDEESADIRQIHFLSEFIDYVDRGFTVEPVASREVKGAIAYGLRIYRKDGSYDARYYFDPRRKLPVLLIISGRGPQVKGMAMETYLDDYREVDDVVMPFRLETRNNGQLIQRMHIEAIDTEATVADDFFRLPKE